MSRALLPLAAATFAVGTDAFVLAGVLPQIVTSFRVNATTAGQLVTVYGLAYAVASPVMAASTARWPRRWVLIGGLAVFTAGNVVTAAAPAFELMLAGRVIAGLGGAMVTPIAFATAAALASDGQRGRALAVVTAGLSAATALGSPIGTALGDAASWRATMLLVVGLGVVAAVGVGVLLPPTPSPPAIGLRDRLAPVTDLRVALVLATSLAVFGGQYTVYTYVSVAFDRATSGDGATLAALLFVWGVAATVGNLVAGRLTDRYGSRWIINGAALLVATDLLLLPWTSQHLGTAVPAVIVWSMCGWGMIVPNVHRLLGIAPAQAPLLNGLNSSAVYLGASLSGLIGAAGIEAFGPAGLGPLGAALVVVGLGFAELARHAIVRGLRAGSDVSRLGV